MKCTIDGGSFAYWEKIERIVESDDIMFESTEIKETFGFEVFDVNKIMDSILNN